MRISGTYINRLTNTVIPYTVLTSLVFGLIADKSAANITLYFLAFTFIAWVLDSVVIYNKRLASVVLDGSIRINNEYIKPADILEISEQYGRAYFLAVRIFRIKIYQSNGIKVVSVMDKPKNLVHLFMGIHSRTLDSLFLQFPELEQKLQ